MDLLPLFPTAIASFTDFITEEERVELFENIKKINHHKHGFLEGKSFSSHWERGRDGVPPQINVLNNIIRERVQNSVDEYVKEYGILSCKITNICHRNSTISGSLYINANDFICFHNPNPYVFYTAANSNNYYHCESYNIPVKSRQLILFPSWLKHGKNDAPCNMDNRIVISFNINYMINFE